jgi:hypothetical protein
MSKHKTKIYKPGDPDTITCGQKAGGELTNESDESVREVKKWVDDNEK